LIPAFFGSGFVLYEIFGLPIIKDGLLLGSLRALQFAILITAASMVNASTSFMEIGDSIRILLKPIAGKTANKIAIVLSITMRFVPILHEEAHRILDAQKARGAFLERNLLIKLKQMTTLIVPIFNSVFRKADILARSLDVRGYNFEANRTHYVKLKLKKYDFILIFLSITLLIFALYTRL
jgi:energy-coupling factor transport system permease protein